MTSFHTWSARRAEIQGRAAPPSDLPRAASAPPTTSADSLLPPGVSQERRAALAARFIDGMGGAWFGDRAAGITPVLPIESWPQAYIAPNEHYPACMLPLTYASMQGVYVGVGTERCWMTAAMHPQLQRLYLIDRDPRVVYYNRINAALLGAAGGARARYLYLRLGATQAEWAAAAARLARPQKALLRTPEAHAWWEERVRRSLSVNMRAFHLRRQTDAFAGANYLWNDTLFANLSRLATRETGVEIREMDLTSGAQVTGLRCVLGARGESISLLDISNAWWPEYVPFRALRRMLENLSPALAPRSLLLATSKHERPRAGGRQAFYYFTANPLAVLEAWPAFQRYLRQLRDTPRAYAAVNRPYLTAAELRQPLAPRAA